MGIISCWYVSNERKNEREDDLPCWRREFHHSPLGNENCKALLSKMMIVGKNSGNAFLAASVNGDTVSKAIAFIKATFIKIETR